MKLTVLGAEAARLLGGVRRSVDGRLAVFES
jgi:hypothetical protein